MMRLVWLPTALINNQLNIGFWELFLFFDDTLSENQTKLQRERE